MQFKCFSSFHGGVLPDDLLERILVYLPFADLVTAGTVCARWCGIITSETFRKKLLLVTSQRPWFLGPPADSYDPVYNVWFKLKIPRFKLFCGSVIFASSTGLISAFGKDERGITSLYVCNPLTRRCSRAPIVKYMNFTALVISVSRTTPSYRVSIVTTKGPLEHQVRWELWIHLYDSETRMWETCVAGVLRGWRSGDESTICDGVLYFLIYDIASPSNSCGLVMYDLSGQCSNDLLASFVPVPCPQAHKCLLNMKEKLVLVRVIYAADGRLMSFKGVGIWVLNGREWHEIARSPDDIFLGFESASRFKSCGSNDLICILIEHCAICPPCFVTFDMNQKRWSRNSLAKIPSPVRTGFCFKPRLGIVP